MQSESELIHFFESRFLDESKLIHSGVYLFGYPQTHFWGVPQTPSLLLCDDSDADDACDAVLRISLYHIPDSASLASSASF